MMPYVTISKLWAMAVRTAFEGGDLLVMAEGPKVWDFGEHLNSHTESDAGHSFRVGDHAFFVTSHNFLPVISRKITNGSCRTPGNPRSPTIDNVRQE